MMRAWFIPILFAAAFLAGCSESKPAPRVARQGAAPVSQPDPPKSTTTGVKTTLPVSTSSNNPGTDTTTKPPVTPVVKPPDPPPVVAPPPVAKHGQEVGQAAPEVVLQDTAGTVFMLSSFKGKKPVLLVFGATWCGSCAAALPALIQTNEKYSSKGLVVAEVMLGEDAGKAKKYAQDRGVSHLLLPDEQQLSRSRYGYEVDDMPLHVLIARDGTVIANSHTVPSADLIEKALK